MRQMHRTSLVTRRPPSVSLRLSPAMLGAACCIFAAVGYTAANTLLRKLTVQQDPMWLLCVKESVAVVLLGPWLAYRAMRGRPSLPSGRPLLALVIVGILTQVAGNLPLIWAMGVVGLAISIPVSIGVNLAACAVLGQTLLGERVSFRSAIAVAALVVSVVLLSTGAGQANDSIAASAEVVTGGFWSVMAVGGACLAGVIFGFLNVTIRRSATAGVPLLAIGFMVPAMATATLAPACLWRHGLNGLLATPPQDFLLMLVCGVLNIAAYLAIIKGLQLTTIVHANVLAASQVAMAALAGLLFFQEAASPSLATGILLTIAGTALIDRPVVETSVAE